MDGQQYFIFSLDSYSYAIKLDIINKVVRAAATTSVPHGPGNLAGLLNLHGKILPVLNIRKCFELPEREIEMDDRIVIVHTAKGLGAFVVNVAKGVFPLEQKENDEQLPIRLGRYFYGVGKIGEQTVLICEPHKLFEACL